MKIARLRDVIFWKSWNVLPFESFQIEHIQVGCHSALCDETSSLDICETKNCRGTKLLTKRYILEPTTVVEAPCWSEICAMCKTESDKNNVPPALGEHLREFCGIGWSGRR